MEINNDLGGVRFGYDSSTDVYGYKKVGADTLYPFSSKTIHTGTLTLTSSGTTDMGEEHTYRYVNASNVAGKCDLLWTNSAPTNTFADQTLSINLTNYDGVFIFIKAHTGTRNMCTNTIHYCFKSNTSITLAAGIVDINGAWYGCYRIVSNISNSGIIFGSGGYAYATTYNSNTCGIPLKIYGVKCANLPTSYT